jgi:hypothetical protein
MSKFDSMPITLSGRLIKIQRGNSGKIFEIDENVASLSNTLSQFFASAPDFDKDNDIFPVDQDRFSSDETLRKIIFFMDKFAQEPFGELPKPFPKDQGLGPVGPIWAKEYFEKASLQDCMQILKGAHYLDIKPLLQLCAVVFALQIYNKNYDQICETVGVWKDNYHKWVPNDASDKASATTSSSSSSSSTVRCESGPGEPSEGRWVKCDRSDPDARIDFSPIEAIRNEYKSPGDIFHSK